MFSLSADVQVLVVEPFHVYGMICCVTLIPRPVKFSLRETAEPI
jgi:hypothetical protein